MVNTIEINAPAPIMMRRGEKLDERTLSEIARRLGEARKSAMSQMPGPRKRQATRYEILMGQIVPHAQHRLGEIYMSETARQGTMEHVSSALNPAQDIVRRLCLVYKRGAQRSIVKGSKKVNKAMAEAYRSTMLDLLGSHLSRIAYFVGPVHLIPRIRGNRVSPDIVLPHKCEVILDADDPTGRPVAIAYLLGSDGRVAIQGEDFGLTGRIVGGALGNLEPLPGALWATLRYCTAIDPDDWACSWEHERIKDGAIDVTVTAAVMNYVRKTQNKQLLVLTGQLDQLLKRQNLGDPDKPVTIPATPNATSQATLESIDFDQPVESFLAHMRFWYMALAEASGVSAMVQGDSSTFGIQFSFDGLSELRDEQVIHTLNFERDFFAALVKLGAIDGLTLEAAQGRFQCDFGELSRNMVDPLAEQQADDWRLRHGIISVVDLVMRENPGISKDDARELMTSNLDENTAYWDIVARTNGAASGTVDSGGGVSTAAQNNGAMGPKVRDGREQTDE